MKCDPCISFQTQDFNVPVSHRRWANDNLKRIFISGSALRTSLYCSLSSPQLHRRPGIMAPLKANWKNIFITRRPNGGSCRLTDSKEGGPQKCHRCLFRGPASTKDDKQAWGAVDVVDSLFTRVQHPWLQCSQSVWASLLRNWLTSQPWAWRSVHSQGILHPGWLRSSVSFMKGLVIEITWRLPYLLRFCAWMPVPSSSFSICLSHKETGSVMLDCSRSATG